MLESFEQSLDPLTGWKTYDSPYCRIVAKGHEDTIFSFSAINCQPGRFFTTKTFASDPRNVVFLNCPKNSWYLDGIPPFGNDIPATAAGLLRFLAGIGIGQGRKIFWGGSMGGYGAVAMGALMQADHVIATGAELELLAAGGNSDLILRKIQGRSGIRPPEVARWVEDSHGSYFLYCGDFAYHDVISLRRLCHLPKVRYRTLRDFGHPLPAYIERTYGLVRFIDHHLHHHSLFPFSKGEAGVLGEHPDWWSNLHAAAAAGDENAASCLRRGLSDGSLPDDLRAHMANALSLHARESRDLHSSLAYAQAAAELDGGHSGFHSYRLACAMRDHGESPARWMEAALSIPDLHDPDRWEFGENLLRMLHRGLLDDRGEEAAETFLRRQISLSGKNPKRVDFLNSLRSGNLTGKTWQVSITRAAGKASMKFRLDREQLPAGGKLLVSGLFVPRHEDDQIVAFSLNDPQAVMNSHHAGLDSPGAAAILPELPWAARSRFRIEIQPGQTETLTVRARTATGQEWDFIEIALVDRGSN